MYAVEVFFFFWILRVIDASHYRGGTFTWKPVGSLNYRRPIISEKYLFR